MQRLPGPCAHGALRDKHEKPGRPVTKCIDKGHVSGSPGGHAARNGAQSHLRAVLCRHCCPAGHRPRCCPWSLGALGAAAATLLGWAHWLLIHRPEWERPFGDPGHACTPVVREARKTFAILPDTYTNISRASSPLSSQYDYIKYLVTSAISKHMRYGMQRGYVATGEASRAPGLGFICSLGPL